MPQLKNLLILLFLLPAFIFFSKPVFATCTSGSTIATKISCSDGFFCSTQAECVNQHGGTNVAAPLISKPTVQTGCIETALGCIDVSTNAFVKTLLTFAIGLGGAIALLLMLYGFFILATSAGIPDKVKAGKEIITSAIAGLLFIILSVVLYNLIGSQLLGLPGL